MIAVRALCVGPLVMSLGAMGCRIQSESSLSAADSAAAATRRARVAERLADSANGPDAGRPVARWLLPVSLAEISGIALTEDERILAHGDELGRVSVIDPRRGVLLKEFSIGARSDFEGITRAGSTIYMVDSNGQLYAFQEGAHGQRVSYRMEDTRLGRECEFEGVAYDPRRHAMLLPCKNIEKRGLRNNVLIYIWQLDPVSSPRISRISVPLRQAIGNNKWKSLRPTDITVDPTTGNYLIVAAPEKALLELTPNGDVVRSLPLPNPALHAQAEGIAIMSDGILLISDEGSNRPAALTLYRWPLVATNSAPP